MSRPDRTIEARRPDLILIDKIADECKNIDVAMLSDKKNCAKRSTQT